ERDGDWVQLTAEPTAEATFTTPVMFATERCFAVQAVRAADQVTIEGAVSSPVCLTAVDTYPPPVPDSVVLLQEGTGVTIMWEAVEAADLAGYIVLRGDGPDGALTPLFDTPVAAATFRDTTVSTGATYSYALQAVDAAPPANDSVVAPREVIAVREVVGGRNEAVHRLRYPALHREPGTARHHRRRDGEPVTDGQGGRRSARP